MLPSAGPDLDALFAAVRLLGAGSIGNVPAQLT